ncbi:MAG: dihydroneopterin aldolase [Candidatus Kapabacteria bacterium]|nr:dihydroneopterin aldolase [Candidatus Kapabacteria bacterium]
MKETSITRLSVKDAEYYAYHGVKPEEKKLGGKYQVDLDLYYDAKNAFVNDDVGDALNYEEALYCVSEVINGDSYDLIETIANEILNAILEKFTQLDKATVRVRKMGAPIQQVVRYVEVEQTMTRRKI